MYDQIRSPSEYSQLITDNASSIGDVASSLQSHCSCVPSFELPLSSSNAVMAEHSGILLIGGAGKVIVWSMRKNEQVDSLSTSGIVRFLKLSDMLIASVDSKPSLILWEMLTLRKIKEMHASVPCVAFGDKQVFVPTHKNRIDVLNLQGDLVDQVEHTEATVTALEFSNGNLFVACESGALHIIKNNNVLHTFESHRSKITHLLVSKDLVISVSSDKTIVVRSQHTLEASVLRVTEDCAAGVSITTDDKYLVTASSSNKINVISLRSLDVELEIKNLEDNISSVLVTKDSSFIVTSSSVGVRVWDFSSQSDDSYFAETASPVHSFCYSFDNQYLLAASEGSLLLYDTILASRETVLSNMGLSATSVTTSKDLIIVGFSDGLLQVLSSSYEKVSQSREHAESIVGLVSVSDSLLYSSSKDSSIFIWKLPSLDLIRGLKLRVGPLMTVSEEWLLTSESTSVEIWDIREPTSPAHWGSVDKHLDTVTALDIAEESEFALSGSADCSMVMFNIKKCRSMRVFTHHVSPIVCVKCQKQYEIIISASEDRSVFLWSLADMQVLIRLEVPDRPISLQLQALYGNLVFATTRGIYLLKNPVQTDKILVYPPTYASVFLYWVSQILTNKKPVYNPDWKSYLIFPWKINALHLLSHAGHLDALSLAMADGAVFIRSDRGETPLTMAIQRRNRLVIDTVLSYAVASDNLGVWNSIEEVIHTLNSASLPSLPKVYNSAFPVSQQQDLPSFGVLRSAPPVIRFSHKRRIDPADFQELKLGKKAVEEALEFRESRIGLNLLAGSAESLFFLRSLQNCENLAVFSALYVQSVLGHKMEKCHWFAQLRAVVLFLLTVCLTVNAFLDYNFVLLVFSLVFSSSLLALEAVKLYQLTVEYFLKLTNVSKFVIGVLTVAYCSIGIAETSELGNKMLSAVLVFLLGVRCVFSLKVYSYFRQPILYMERMISSFFPVFVVIVFTIVGFVLTMSVTEEGRIDHYLEIGFLLIFSDFSFAEFSAKQLWLLVVFSVIIPLFLFNMIIGRSIQCYEYVSSNYTVLSYKDMTDTLYEIEIYMFWNRNRGRRKFVLMCSNPDYARQSEINDEYRKMIKKQKQIASSDCEHDEIQAIFNEMGLLKEEIKNNFHLVTKKVSQN